MLLTEEQGQSQKPLSERSAQLIPNHIATGLLFDKLGLLTWLFTSRLLIIASPVLRTRRSVHFHPRETTPSGTSVFLFTIDFDSLSFCAIRKPRTKNTYTRRPCWKIISCLKTTVASVTTSVTNTSQFGVCAGYL